MKRSLKISRILLFLGVLLFFMLALLSFFDAYRSEKQKFNMTKQILFGNAFYKSNINSDVLNQIYDSIDAGFDIKTSRWVDSVVRQSAGSYKNVLAEFERLLLKNDIYATFKGAVIISYFDIEINGEKVILFDTDHKKSFLLVDGNTEAININNPNNNFYLKTGKHETNIRISAYAVFDNLFLYIIGQLWIQLVFLLFMLVFFITVTIFTLRTLNKQATMDQMKTDFINNMNHELKTPITTLALITKTIDDSNNKEAIGILNNQVKRLEEIMNKVIELSKLDYGKIEKNPININQFISKIVNEYHWQGKLTIHSDNQTDYIIANEFLLETALKNLIDNAMKYGDGQIVTLSVKGDNNINFIVSNSGKSIPRMYQKYIFDKFYRAPRNDGKTINGSGLGLFLVKQITLAHGGKTWATSKEGSQTKFYISIPQQ